MSFGLRSIVWGPLDKILVYLDAEPVKLLCDVGLDRPRGGHIRGTGWVPIFLLRKPATVERVGLIRLKAEGFIVVGYGTVEATALQMDERSAAEGKWVVGAQPQGLIAVS